MSCRNSSEKNRELSNDIVVTIILLLSSKFCRSSMLSGAERRPPTTGFWNDSSIAPISRSLPSVQNRSMVCFRNKSLGTIMQVFEQHPDTTVAIMTSVFPVPVGITIVADLCDTVQCDLIAYIAPNWAVRKPELVSDVNSGKLNLLVFHDCQISVTFPQVEPLGAWAI